MNLAVSDLGNTGSGGTLAASDSIGLTIQAVNDAPQLAVPTNLSVNEDTELAVGGISVTDVDSGAADLRVTLQVSHGRLTLGTISGLTFVTGDGTADPTLVFRGSLTNINAALATLNYRAELNYNGADALKVAVSDLGNTGSGGPLLVSGNIDLTVVPVNNAPTTKGLPDVKVDEDATVKHLDLFAVFDDVEQADSTLDYRIVDVSNQRLFTGVSIDRDNGWLVIRLAPDMHGAGEITVCVQDAEGLVVEDTFGVNVKSINDAPVASPDGYTVRGDEVLVVAPSGILSNDTDVDADALSTRLVRAPLHGNLTLNADGSFRYEPNPSFVGIDTFTYVATDGPDRSQRTQVAIQVTVPSSPVDPNPGNSGQVPPTNTIPSTTPGLPSAVNHFNVQALFARGIAQRHCTT